MKAILENNLKATSFRGQEGNTKVFALVSITIVVLAIHAGWNFLPALYQTENFKQQMPNAILQVMSVPHAAAEPLSDKIKKRLRTLGNENNIPSNALIEVQENSGSYKAHVKFTKEVNILPFGIYKYQFQFDNTASQ